MTATVVVARNALKLVSANFSRPADTNAYTAGDVIADSTSAASIITFTGVGGDEAGQGIIRQALLLDEADLATKLNAELYLFSSVAATPPAAYGNDNGAFVLTNANLRDLIGVITFNGAGAFVTNAGVDAAGNVAILTGGLAIPFKLKASQSNLYGILVARNAYTPVSAERFNITLGIEL